MSTSGNESEAGPSEADRARIRAEEIFRAEVQQELAALRPAPTGLARAVTFLNTSLGMWVLGTVVLGSITFAYSNIQKSIEATRQEAVAEAFRADRERRLVSEIDSRIRRLDDLEWESPERSEQALQRFLSGSEEAKTEFGTAHLGTILHDLIGVTEESNAPIRALERYNDLSNERARLLRFLGPQGGFPEQILDAMLRTRMQTQRFVIALEEVSRQSRKGFPLWNEEHEVFFELLPRRGDFVYQSIARELFNQVRVLAAKSSNSKREEHQVFLVSAEAPEKRRNARTGRFLEKVPAKSPLTPRKETPFRVNLHAIVLTGETPADNRVKYRVRIIHGAGALIAFGGTYPMTDSNRVEDQLESRLDYYRVSRLMSDALQRVH